MFFSGYHCVMPFGEGCEVYAILRKTMTHIYPLWTFDKGNMNQFSYVEQVKHGKHHQKLDMFDRFSAGSDSHRSHIGVAMSKPSFVAKYLAILMMLEESLQRRCPGILAVGLAKNGSAAAKKNSWACHESISHPPVFLAGRGRDGRVKSPQGVLQISKGPKFKHPSSVYRSNTRPSGPRLCFRYSAVIRWVAPKRINLISSLKLLIDLETHRWTKEAT